MNQYQAEYSKLLCKSLGEGYDSVILTNSGGEANDFAMTLAKLYTGSNKFLSLRNAYHGLVGGASGLTNIGSWNQNMLRGLDH
jgi:4-aminobutyrate aminotransferase-like enzyme